MSGTRCAMYGCNNTYESNKGRADDIKITMHVFPKSKDSLSQTIRKEWVTRCNRRDKFNPDTSRICSEHFAATDYERDLQHELLGLPVRKKLKKTAVPASGIIKEVSKRSQSAISPDETISKRSRKEQVDLIATVTSGDNQQKQKLTEDVLVTNQKLNENISKSAVENMTNMILEDSNSHMKQLAGPILKGRVEFRNNEANDTSLMSPSTSATSDPISKSRDEFDNNEADDKSLISPSISGTSAKDIQNDKEKYTKLLKEHDSLKLEYRQMERNLKKRIKSLHDQVRYFKAKYYNGPKPKKAQIDAQTILKKILTENQIALLSNKKRKINWTNDEISVAFTLWYYSKKCYLFLKNRLNYPLPSLSTLRKYQIIIESDE